MIDVHCHLEYIEEPEKVIFEAKEKGMKGIVSSVADPKEAKKMLELQEKFSDFLFLALGFHPEYIEEYSEKEIEEYFNFIREQKGKIVAIGEVGLDYFHDSENKEKQKEIFRKFIDLAKELNLPLVVHCREAWNDVLEMLKEKNVQKVCLHCFSGSEGNLKEAVSRGYFISFATNLCYTKKHPRLLEKTPLENLLLETDSPWLNPENPKELKNRPWNIFLSAKKVAEIKKISFEKVLEIVLENAKKCFQIMEMGSGR